MTSLWRCRLCPISKQYQPALPLFLARAGLDRPGLNRALDTFVKQALYHNLDLEVRNLPQAGHGFDMFEDSPAGASGSPKRTGLHSLSLAS